MAKLEGYKAVAVTKEGYYKKKYYYAIYDDGETYNVGDKILVSGANKDILTIDDIIAPDECNVNITAEGAQRRVAGDLHQTVRERHDKARHAEGGDAADAGEVRPEAAKTDFQLGLPPGQEAQNPHGGKSLRNHGRDGRAAHAEVQCKDKHRVEHEVCDRAHDNGQHADFRETLTVYVWI